MNDIIVNALTMDSRRIQPGNLFIAVPGLTVDGRNYIEQAIKKGAVAVLVEAPASVVVYERETGIPLIPIPRLAKLAGHIASRFFCEPSKSMPVIGITGTNGKTSVANFIAQIFSYCRQTCGIMGSLGTGFLNDLHPIQDCNTPDAITVQARLAELKNKGASRVVMEVTSHGLDQNRVEGVQFHTAIFTNLTRDHLEYHQTMEHYGAAKQKLFTDFQPLYSIINVDDAFGLALAQDKRLYQNDRTVIGYTLAGEKTAAVCAENILLHDAGIHAWVRTPWGEGRLESTLFGRFNISNLLAALAAVCIQDVPFALVLEAIKSITTVPGRMTRLGGKQNAPCVIVDYAHTPDALAQVLTAVRAHCRGKVWCIFGCGGDRDRGKRPLMAAIAEQFSDHLCITQDNPRTEDPHQIFQDILQGIQNKKVTIEPDRKTAIAFTICAANKEDWIVVAGKGHEEYQILGTDKIPFSDHACVQAALEKRMV